MKTDDKTEAKKKYGEFVTDMCLHITAAVLPRNPDPNKELSHKKPELMNDMVNFCTTT